MEHTSAGASRRLSREVSAVVTGFDSVLLTNVVRERFADDAQLVALAEATIRLADAADTRRRELGDDEIAEQHGACSHLLEQWTRERLAELCELVVSEARTWTGRWDTMQIEAAVEEADGWLRTNTNAAERAGVAYGASLDTEPRPTSEHAKGDDRDRNGETSQ